MSYNLQFDLLYEPTVGGGFGYRCETLPLWLQIYASHEFRPPAPTTLQYTSMTATAKRPISIMLEGAQRESDVYAPLRDAGGYASFAAVGRQFVPGRASRSAAIVFNAYATTYTEDNNPAISRVGSALLSMSQLLQLARGSVAQANLIVTQNTKLSTTQGSRKDEPLVKGKLTISSLRIFQSDGGTQVSAEQFERDALLPPQPLDTDTIRASAATAECMRDLVALTMAAFSTRGGRVPLLPTPTEPFLMHFHCPEWRLSRLSVPAFAYLAYRSHAPSARSFYLQAQRVALRRSRLTLDEALECARLFVANGGGVGEKENAFLCFISRLVTLFATSMCYLDDFVNSNKVGAPMSEANIEITEDMKSPRVTRADDCEGTALEAFMECVELIERIARLVASSASSSAEDRLLAQVSATLSLYVPCMSLFAVTNKKAVPASALGAMAAGGGDEVPAHTIALLIPYHQFERWVADSFSRERMRATKFYRARASALEQCERAGCKLPLLLLDGTARSDPEMLPASEYFSANEKADGTFGRALNDLHDRLLLTDSVLEMIKNTRLSTELFVSEAELTDEHKKNKRDISDFYKLTVKVQTLATAEFGQCDFAAVYRQPPAKKCTYGVFFNDFALLSERVGLTPYLTVKPVDMAKIDMLLAGEEFVPPLAATPSAVSTLDVVDSRLATLVRGGSGTPSATLLHPRTIVLAARAQDIGDDEILALQKVVALQSVTRVDVDIFRLVDAVSGVGGPCDVVDITLYY